MSIGRYMIMNVLLRNRCYVFLIFLLSACSKADSSNAYDSPNSPLSVQQDAAIKTYIQTHNLTMTKDESGMYYQILDGGDSTQIMTLNDVPTIIYTRKNLQDSLLDASFGSTDFDGRELKDHIAGWQIGLRKIGKGGSIFMIIPSDLGFGNVAVGNIIPANTVLVCNVQLVDFK